MVRDVQHLVETASLEFFSFQWELF